MNMIGEEKGESLMKRTNKAICLLLALLMLVPSFGQISVQAADTYENIAKDSRSRRHPALRIICLNWP